MRKISSVVMLFAIVAAGCGIGSVSDAPPETVALTSQPVVSTTVPTTTVAAADPIPNTDVNHTLPVPPVTTIPPLPTTTIPYEPVFEFAVYPVTEETVALTWREGCPLHWEELTMLSLSYWNFDGRPVKGRMVVNTTIVDDVVMIFEKLFEAGFPIERIALVDDYGGDDKEAMRHNVTSGFNCRYVDGTERWSNHAFGLAIDINPLINPWAREDNVLPLEGTRYAWDRENPIPGMVNAGDRVIAIFEEAGWSWGGVWGSADYMHFSKPGN